MVIGDYQISAANNVIEGNSIGTDITGSKALGNQFDGIALTASAGATTIGGTTAGAGNVISGSGWYGIEDSARSAVTTIQGNLIGTDASGTIAIGNQYGGITVDSYYLPPQLVIGGTTTGAGNVISGNGGDGIDLTDGTSGNIVEGNLIGTDAVGASTLGNAGAGIRITNASGNNTVGGTIAGAGNTIADNAAGGVFVGASATDASTGNAILSNAIFANGGLGIDLGSDGVTSNHVRGLIAGPNGFENDPVLTSAVSSGGTTKINGTLDAAGGTTLTVQFFLDATADPSGHGQGQTYLGSVAVTTDSAGKATFTATFSVAVPVGQFISATATDPGGNTSEFAQDIAVTPGVSASATTAAMVTISTSRNATVALPTSAANTQAADALPIGAPDDDIVTDLARDILDAAPRKSRS